MKKGTLLSIVAIEDVKKAFLLEKNNTDVLVCDTSEKFDVLMGISQIWVHPSARRQNVATKMIDVIRKNFIYGIEVNRNQCAFSQPTRQGKLFAERYMEPQPLLVYVSGSYLSN